MVIYYKEELANEEMYQLNIFDYLYPGRLWPKFGIIHICGGG
jgi:hypothetical protein